MGINTREPSTGAINGLAPVNNQTMRPRAWSAGDAKHPPAPKPPSLVPPSAGAIATDLRADTHIPNKRNNRQCVLVLKASVGEGSGPLTSLLLWAFIQSCLENFGGPQPGQQLITKRPLVSDPSVFGVGRFPRKISYAAALAAPRHFLVGLRLRVAHPWCTSVLCLCEIAVFWAGLLSLVPKVETPRDSCSAQIDA